MTMVVLYITFLANFPLQSAVNGYICLLMIIALILLIFSVFIYFNALKTYPFFVVIIHISYSVEICPISWGLRGWGRGLAPEILSVFAFIYLVVSLNCLKIHSCIS